MRARLRRLPFAGISAVSSPNACCFFPSAFCSIGLHLAAFKHGALHCGLITCLHSEITELRYIWVHSTLTAFKSLEHLEHTAFRQYPGVYSEAFRSIQRHSEPSSNFPLRSAAFNAFRCIRMHSDVFRTMQNPAEHSTPNGCFLNANGCIVRLNA